MNEHAPHVEPVRTYVLVWLALIIFTGVTAWVAEIDLGEWNIVVALAIAAIKASLVVLFFMHVKDSNMLTKLFAVAGLFWVAIMFGLTFADYISRDWLPLSRWR
jgi:cytochrome c oxidase subunit 4